MGKRKDKMDHAASKLWSVAIELLQLMGYRPDFEGVPFSRRDQGVMVLKHRDRKHQIRPDVESIVRFYTTTYRIVPFEYDIDSRTGRLVLRKGYLRPKRPKPPGRAIIV